MSRQLLICLLGTSILGFILGIYIAYWTANFQVQIDLNSGHIRGVYSVCGITTHKTSDFQYNYIGGLIVGKTKWQKLYDYPNIHQHMSATNEFFARRIFIAGNLIRVMPEHETQQLKDNFLQILNSKGKDAAFRYLEDVENELTRKYRKGDDWRHLEPVIPFSEDVKTDTAPQTPSNTSG